MRLIMNGQTRNLEELAEGSSVADLMAALGMQADRVALEKNGAIVTRTDWSETVVESNDRLEIVHFVGGGSSHPRD